MSGDGMKEMDKRKATRIIAGYKASIAISGDRYEAVVENLSESGICVLTFPLEIPVGFAPGESVDLHIEAPTGEILDIVCKVKWSSTIPPHNITRSIGAEIVDPPWEQTGCFV